MKGLSASVRQEIGFGELSAELSSLNRCQIVDMFILWKYTRKR